MHKTNIVLKYTKFIKVYVFNTIVSTETGEILDDAQGYGYRTAQKAYAAYSYKTRDRSKDAEKHARRQEIMKWFKEHNDFKDSMDQIAFEIAKGFFSHA